MVADKNIFSTSDLAVLWDITNKNTLWTTTRRYVQRGSLYRIRTGLYSKLPTNMLNPFEIGCSLAGPFSYVSLETILAQHGVIMQQIDKVTLVGVRRSEHIIDGTSYSIRGMADKFLLNRVGVNDDKMFSVSTIERAVADMYYYSPKYYLDNENPIDWDKVKSIKEEVGY